MVTQVYSTGIYVHTAWATSADGKQGFSLTAFADATYIGSYSDDDSTDASTPSLYKWTVLDEDAEVITTSSASPTRQQVENRTQLEQQQINQDDIADEIGAAATTANYFWFEPSGSYIGANITQEEKDTFIADTTNDPTTGGGNVNITSSGVAVRDGLMDFAKFETSGMTVYTYNGVIPVVVAHLGYGAGVDSGGGTSYAPYCSLGPRLTASTIGNYSCAEGAGNTASGYTAHAEGNKTTASEASAHAEGFDTEASGAYSHAEGEKTEANDRSSHAEGRETVASGSYSHAEGGSTTSSGNYSHAEGASTVASAYCSHAAGEGVKASCPRQTAVGKYNVEDYSDYGFIVGNGTADNARSDAFAVAWTGDVEAAGDITDGSGNVLSNKSEVSWSQVTATGTKIATVTIDGTATDVYAPTGGGGGLSYDDIYPVGSIYQTTDSGFDPNVSFSGTWTRITDTFLMAAGTTYPGGTTGGSATATLRRSDLPNDTVTTSSNTHHHSLYIGANGASGSARTVLLTSGSTRNTSDNTHSHTFDLNGGVAQTSVDTLPPYLAVYVWQRTA